MKKLIPFVLSLVLLAGCGTPSAEITPDNSEEIPLSGGQPAVELITWNYQGETHEIQNMLARTESELNKEGVSLYLFDHKQTCSDLTNFVFDQAPSPVAKIFFETKGTAGVALPLAAWFRNPNLTEDQIASQESLNANIGQIDMQDGGVSGFIDIREDEFEVFGGFSAELCE